MSIKAKKLREAGERPPEESGGFVWFTRSMLESEAWQTMPLAGPDAPQWGNQLTGYRAVAEGFMSALRGRSVFFRILADNAFARVPMRTRLATVTARATAAIIGKGKPVPASRLTLQGSELDERKAAALLVATDELLRSEEPGVESLLGRELRGAVAAAVDVEFLACIVDDDSPPGMAASGTSAKHALADMRALFG